MAEQFDMFSEEVSRGRVTKLLLDVPFIDFGRGSEASTKGVPGELEGSFELAEIATHTGSQCCAFDQSRHLFVV